jgi:hypothetical protein
MPPVRNAAMPTDDGSGGANHVASPGAHRAVITYHLCGSSRATNSNVPQLISNQRKAVVARDLQRPTLRANRELHSSVSSVPSQTTIRATNGAQKITISKVDERQQAFVRTR